MKLNHIKNYIVLFLLLAPLRLAAQDVRSTETKVADLLALLPADNNQLSYKLFHELLATGDEGLNMVTDQLQPNGNTKGIPARYAVSLLTFFARTPSEKAFLEKAYLAALGKSTTTEVKAYLISNLKLIGSDASVPTLSRYAGDKDLYDPAIGALVTISTQKSGEAMQNLLQGAAPNIQARLIKGLGEMKYQWALSAIVPFANGPDINTRKQALWTLALAGDEASFEVLRKQAEAAGYNSDPSEAMLAFLEYQHQMAVYGISGLVRNINQLVMANSPAPSQQCFRLASLSNLAKVDSKAATAALIMERASKDAEYRRQVLNLAQTFPWDDTTNKLWMTEFRKARGPEQAELLSLLSQVHMVDAFTRSTLIPSLSSADQQIRMTAAGEIGRRKDKKYLPTLADYLAKATNESEILQARKALLQVTDQENCSALIPKLAAAPSRNKVAMLEIFSERWATQTFDQVAGYCASKDAVTRASAFAALANVSSGPKMSVLLKMLSATTDAGEIKALQSAIISILPDASPALVNEAYQKDKVKLLPVLGFLHDNGAIRKVTTAYYDGSEQEKEAAFNTLCSWGNQDAVRTLLTIRKDPALASYHDRAFAALIGQVTKSEWPDDEKLLILREIMTVATSKHDKTAVLRAIGGLRSFLALVFVDGYLEDTVVSAAASRAAMQIALPTADAKPGLSGVVVRNTLEKVLKTLTGPDSQYDRIDITTYLEKMPHTKGFEPVFNGKDLRGWKGLVENPIARSKMTPEQLAVKQAAADAKAFQSWTVRDGAIWFSGDGDNLCTTRMYGDFEMIVDWKNSRNGDSGIYLRGTPQIQVWDSARTDVNARVGSGGLYNNQTGISTPLTYADNPVGEWNTFRITMIGDLVTVYLNGVLVVDHVKMENYWDRNLPIFPEEAIELQAHGTELGFRNIYVREIGRPVALSKAEQEEGFQLLFNGKDLNNWVGNKTDYVIEDTDLAIYPALGGHGNLYTEKEYSDFIYRFEFQLTPGANNGLGIHAPLEGDAAYVGKEIQIIDNPAPVYANLEVYQYHGSVYGVIPARREFLKPVGEWNEEEVYVKGDYIKVTLNGTVITEGDLKKASKKGTMDHKEHPGLKRHTGHIGFLGHGSVVKFRNIRIKELNR